MPASTDVEGESVVKCDRCSYAGPQSSFPQKKNLKYNKSCFACKGKRAQDRADKRSPENDVEGDAGEAPGGARRRRAPPIQPKEGYATLEWHECAVLLGTYKNDAFELETFVAVAGESGAAKFGSLTSGKQMADTVAQLVWDLTGYRFIYKLCKPNSGSKSYSYYCAQNEAETKKSHLHEDLRKRRARMKMCRFPCKGTLQVTVDDENLRLPLRLKLKHHLSHLHYVDISISEDIKNFVNEHKHDSAANIWSRVLARNPDTEVTQKQIYALWSELNEGEWRLDEDQVKSAQMILERLTSEGIQAEIIPLHIQDGIHAIAFAFKEILDGWAEETEELAMDSTWKTNAAQYELYGFVAEAHGQSMPFAFMFTVSSGDAAEHAKTRILCDVLKFINARCPNIMFTLSDKDQAEITACQAEIAKAKHQLCYWHGIKYVEERLAENKPPAAYDPRKAHRVFDFIDPTWAPGVTAVYANEDEDGEGLSEDEDEAGTQMPKPSQTCIPPVFILKHGDVRTPVWPNPPKTRKNATKGRSEFCPKDYRSEIVEMYRTHLHQHPNIPMDDPDKPYISAKEIHLRAAKEVYELCYARDLSQVWAYLWNRWYTPKQWAVWARASCDAIPRLKTTMIVESLWRHVKHRDLAQFNRPRLDLVVNMVFKGLLPRVKLTLDYIRGSRRVGRPRALAGWQVDAKADWVDMSRSDEHRQTEKELKVLRTAPGAKGRQERLQRIAEEKERERGTYTTDIDNWGCSCPYFFKSRFLMCKHLVRKANKQLKNQPLTDLRFWLNLRRNHFPPYYSIPGIHTLIEQDGPESSQQQHTEVLVLGVRAANIPIREERPSVLQVSLVTPPSGQVQEASGREGESGNSRAGNEVDGVQEDRNNASRTDTSEAEEDDEGDGGERVMFSEARRMHLKRCWEEMMGVIDNPHGVHSKMAGVLEGAFTKIENIGGDIGKARKKRKNARTWKDHNANTMFLD